MVTILDTAALHTSPSEPHTPPTPGKMGDTRFMRVLKRKKQYNIMEPKEVALITILLFFQNVGTLGFFSNEIWCYKHSNNSENHLEPQSAVLMYVFFLT